MTGTVHDRAIAAELMALAKIHDPLVGNTGEPISTFGTALAAVAQNLRQRARQLEAAAPPATIGAAYQGDEPPITTVLLRFSTAAVRTTEGWQVTGVPGYHAWGVVRSNIYPWTVVHWPAEGEPQ